MSDSYDRNEHQTLNMMYGTYADVLFVLFPFLVIALQGLWKGDLGSVLMRPDLSIAAAILAGLAMGKFVLGLITNQELGRYKERIVFFIAVTLFAVLGPSMLLIMLIHSGGELPRFLIFVQPILLIVAISLYTTAVSISNVLIGNQRKREKDEADDGDDGEEGEHRSLVLPRRDSHGESV
ncbi:hypothetical protein QQM79_19845 [Marinobacteraceae bacterium S3BR75-40.1]